ncbi:MAG: sigma-70 family RNA polymerase sigma factor [Myxococcales bacterium]|nr:sigma-70 family RNA polymerase sigma factor [Myxococcales bacterium]
MTDPCRARIEATWQVLRQQDGDLGVPLDHFMGRLDAVLADQADRAQALDALVLPDLYLVLGCLAGSDRAIRLFLERFGAYLTRLCQRYAPTGAIAEDVEAQLLATLFTARHADDPTSARLFAYRGAGTLQGWLRVTARRLVIDLLRRQRAEGEPPRLDQLATPGPRQDAQIERSQAAALLRPVFLECVAELSEAERALLRRYYRDGDVLREIGADLGIDTSSVFRRLGTAREKIWKRFQRRARTELGLTEGDLRSLLGSLAAGLDLDELFASALVFFDPVF